MEVEIEVDVPFDNPNLIRACKSPTFNPVPGCIKAFYSCEYEKVYGTVKHKPNMQWYDRPKPGTVINCQDMPAIMCQNRVDKTKLVCPSCGQKVEYKEDNNGSS